ncbi:MAG TPA: hypothetical protein VNS22_02000 [Geminicoccus sp.]|uniref:hypothetical protein n=1 Tax=Geminicoccus sp. TaxID=2024832 RepID=UPI002B9519E8|nr:hypothetical protein [Geminicoccus sp.]HWL67136.1 hypothetical protein [Geminicoccus sp.]
MADNTTGLTGATVLVRGSRVGLGQALGNHADRLDGIEAGQSSGVVGFATKSAMDGNLAFADGTLAQVTNDSTVSNNGTYRKQGASGTGTWVAAVDRVSEVAKTAANGMAASLRSRFPNLVPGYEWEGIGDATVFAGTTATLTREKHKERWSLKIETGATFMLLPEVVPTSGGYFSAGVTVAEKAATTAARILVVQRNASNAEITGARATYALPNAATSTPIQVMFEGLQFDPACTSVRFYFDAGSVAGTMIRLTEPYIAYGAIGGFRPYLEDVGTNLFPDPEFVGFGPVATRYGKRVVADGEPRLRITMPTGTTVTGAQTQTYDIPAVGPFAPGTLLYYRAGLRSDVAGSAVLHVIYLNGSGTEISRTSLSNTATGTRDQKDASAAVPANTATIRVRFQQGNTATYAEFGGVIIGRVPPKYAPYRTSLAGAVPETPPYFDLFPEPEFSGGSGSTVQISKEDGEPVLGFSGTSGTPNRSWYVDAVGKFAPGKPIQVTAEGHTDAATGCEVALLFRDSGGSELSGTRATARSASTTGQYVPLVATTTVPANTVQIQIRFTHWASAGATASKFRRPRLLTTTSPVDEAQLYSLPISKPGLGHAVAHVSPTGSDSTGTGTAGNPWRTLAKALDWMGGVGEIHVRAGDMGAGQLDISKVLDLTVIGDATSAYERPVFRFGTKLTGITKTAGRTKVYQASISLAGPPNFLWQDGTVDTSTAVPIEEQHAGLRGRGHRLPCVRIERTTATITNDALDEIDATTEPRCFYTSGTLYFSIQGGGNPADASIYVSNGNGLISGTPSFWTPVRGTLRMVGLEVRYGGINTRGITRTYLQDCTVLGAPLNGFDLAWWSDLQDCEAAGSGSFNTDTGDGFNWHNFAVCRHRGLYTHDNHDDGMSSHENCYEMGESPIAEYNIGGGLVPAYGAHAVYTNPITRKNAVHRLSGTKLGGIEAHAAPATGDDGVATTCEVYGGVSIGDRNGLVDGKTKNGTECYLKAFDVTVIDPVEYAARCAMYGNIRHIGSGTAKHPSAGSLGVRNGALVS